MFLGVTLGSKALSAMGKPRDRYANRYGARYVHRCVRRSSTATVETWITEKWIRVKATDSPTVLFHDPAVVWSCGGVHSARFHSTVQDALNDAPVTRPRRPVANEGALAATACHAGERAGAFGEYRCEA